MQEGVAGGKCNLLGSRILLYARARLLKSAGRIGIAIINARASMRA